MRKTSENCWFIKKTYTKIITTWSWNINEARLSVVISVIWSLLNGAIFPMIPMTVVCMACITLDGAVAMKSIIASVALSFKMLWVYFSERRKAGVPRLVASLCKACSKASDEVFEFTGASSWSYAMSPSALLSAPQIRLFAVLLRVHESHVIFAGYE